MGGGPISSSSMESYYNDHDWSRTTRAEEVFKERSMRDEFNPAKMKLPREACDSAESPRSRGIIFAEDVSGSMDVFIHSLIKDEFPRLITQTYDSVSFNPHIMFMGVGDAAAHDMSPLQVTQFETDLRMLDQLQKIYLEGRGGGNGSESYILPWYFAAKHTRMDCFEKRGEKGFLFTFGDEGPTPRLTRDDIRYVFEDQDCLKEAMLTPEECLAMASKKFYCYHVILHGSNYRYSGDEYTRKWRNLMENHVCDLSDHHYIPELVTTIFRMYEGLSKTEALERIEGATARQVVKDALKWHEENVSDVSARNADTEAEYEVF